MHPATAGVDESEHRVDPRCVPFGRLSRRELVELEIDDHFLPRLELGRLEAIDDAPGPHPRGEAGVLHGKHRLDGCRLCRGLVRLRGSSPRRLGRRHGGDRFGSGHAGRLVGRHGGNGCFRGVGDLGSSQDGGELFHNHRPILPRRALERCDQRAAGGIVQPARLRETASSLVDRLVERGGRPCGSVWESIHIAACREGGSLLGIVHVALVVRRCLVAGLGIGTRFGRMLHGIEPGLAEVGRTDHRGAAGRCRRARQDGQQHPGVPGRDKGDFHAISRRCRHPTQQT